MKLAKFHLSVLIKLVSKEVSKLELETERNSTNENIDEQSDDLKELYILQRQLQEEARQPELCACEIYQTCQICNPIPRSKEFAERVPYF